MAEAVVVALEVIGVDHQQSQRRALPQRLLPGLVQAVIEGPAIGDSGEAVAQGLRPQLLVGVLQVRGTRLHDVLELLIACAQAVDVPTGNRAGAEAAQQ